MFKVKHNNKYNKHNNNNKMLMKNIILIFHIINEMNINKDLKN